LIIILIQLKDIIDLTTHSALVRCIELIQESLKNGYDIRNELIWNAPKKYFELQEEYNKLKEVALSDVTF